jgi:hypothetical protein
MQEQFKLLQRKTLKFQRLHGQEYSRKGRERQLRRMLRERVTARERWALFLGTLGSYMFAGVVISGATAPPFPQCFLSRQSGE